MNNSELKAEFRNLKLRVINGEIDFSLKQKAIDKLENELEFIKNTFSDDIISGSISLKLFGLINRDMNDIDIIIKDKSRYTSYSKDSYDDELSENRLGYKSFDYKKGFFSRTKKYEVDFFEDSGSSYTELKHGNKVLKIHNPLEVIDYKMTMAIGSTSSSKHRQDLTDIFTHISLFDYTNNYLGSS